jgi:hypothetical protein
MEISTVYGYSWKFYNSDLYTRLIGISNMSIGLFATYWGLNNHKLIFMNV